MSAFQEMLPADHFPLYVLFIELDPRQLDINVHPTKQEIKFEDEKIVYAFVQAAIRHALAQFSVTPTLDFELDASIQQLSSIQQPFSATNQSAAKGSTLYKSFTEKNQAHFIQPDSTKEAKNWKSFYELTADDSDSSTSRTADAIITQPLHRTPLAEDVTLTQLLKTYITFPSERGFWLIHQQAAHERILYEQLEQSGKEKPVATQRSMFPVSMELNVADATLLEELRNELQHLGFLVEPSGKNSFVIQGAPVDVESGEEKGIIESLLEEYKHFNPDLNFSLREKLIRSLAKQRAVKSNTRLTEREMRQLVNELLVCQQPNITPGGQPTYLEFKQDELQKLFGK
jgi:DNA mismatch repair protein MutL